MGRPIAEKGRNVTVFYPDYPFSTASSGSRQDVGRFLKEKDIWRGILSQSSFLFRISFSNRAAAASTASGRVGSNGLPRRESVRAP
jgi:hypothetical protein